MKSAFFQFTTGHFVELAERRGMITLTREHPYTYAKIYKTSLEEAERWMTKPNACKECRFEYFDLLDAIPSIKSMIPPGYSFFFSTLHRVVLFTIAEIQLEIHRAEVAGFKAKFVAYHEKHPGRQGHE